MKPLTSAALLGATFVGAQTYGRDLTDRDMIGTPAPTRVEYQMLGCDVKKPTMGAIALRDMAALVRATGYTPDFLQPVGKLKVTFHCFLG